MINILVSVSVILIADISVIGMSVCLLIGAPLVTSVTHQSIHIRGLAGITQYNTKFRLTKLKVTNSYVCTSQKKPC